MKKTGAILVAAGMSSRMHDFKPLLPFSNSTIALHNVTMLKKIHLDPIIVITGFRSDELMAHLSSAGVRFKKNERFQTTQMFDSVKLGIEEIADECERILIMPMDIPAIQEETFKLVLAVDAPIVRTKYKDKAGHPIILDKKTARSFLNYEGENGLKGAVHSCVTPPVDVEVSDEGVNKDIDTPEDYKELIEWNYERGNGYPVRPQVEVCLKANELFFDSKTATLLELIAETGSRQAACAEMGLSYSKATKLINTAERQLGFKLVRRWSGGTEGGGSELTEECRKMLDRYKKMVAEVQMAAEKAYRNYMQSL